LSYVRPRSAALIVCLTLALASVDARQSQSQNVTSLITSTPFESYLESLRVQAGIPGLSAAIVQEGQIVWERGFGFQNQEARIRATPDTPYPIGDLSQTIASELVLRCYEERLLSLDGSATRYGISLPEGTASLRNILSHASAGAPGETFKYDSERYGQLSFAVEACIPQPYRKTVAVNILERLAMRDSVPGRDLTTAAALPEPLFATEILERYKKVLDRMAVPYRVDKRGKLTRSELPPEGINASTGLVSTVRDLARFDAALDSFLFLREDTQQQAWTNVVSLGTQRTALPTGLGWFVQTYRDQPVVWQYGLIPGAYSSLIVKLPNRQLTLILLANSEGLNAPFQLDLGDITRSLFATLFLRLYS
jgi:CubicO group peptidase (beta-lactamase class C family)